MKKSEETRLRKLAKEVLEFLGYKNVGVEICLIKSKLMKELNWKFRGRKSDTNILSFEYPSNFPRPKFSFRPLGEIYLNSVYIKRRGEDIECLAIHGLLHLLGFNHKKKNDKMKMERVEKKILWHKEKFWD